MSLERVVAASLVVLAILFFRASQPLAALRAKDEETQCRERLKQLGLAAIQYSDDKRFFPHVAKLSRADDDRTTDQASRKFRSLMFFTYLDDPELFICPSSEDEVAPNALAGPRFGWGGQTESDVAPILRSGCSDHGLDGLEDLSYAWTRRGLTGNSRCSHTVVGDRTAHEDGKIWAAALDGHVEAVENVASIESWHEVASRPRSDEPRPRTAKDLDLVAELAGAILALGAVVAGFVIPSKGAA